MASESTTTSSASDSSTSDDYPSGPITWCIQCISKKATLKAGKTWTVGLILTWTTSVIATILFIVAFGTTGWARAISEVEGEDGSVVRDIGLWQECHGLTGCSLTSTNGGGFKASQALAVLSLVVMLIGLSLSLMYTFCPSQSTHATVGRAVLWSRFIAFLLLLMLICVFSQTWYKPKYASSVHKKHLEYSFKLTAVAFAFEIVGLFFTYCEIRVMDDDKQAPLLPARVTVSHHHGVENKAFNDDLQSVNPGGGKITTIHHDTPVPIEEQVRSHMDARLAFKSFENNHNQNAGVQYPPKHVHRSRDSIFRSHEDITRRFTGITLAEPEYGSEFGSQNTITMYQEHGNPSIRDPRHGVTQSVHPQNLPLKDHSVSMQNLYQNEMDFKRDPKSGKLITSVSMYNLHEEASPSSRSRNHDKESVTSHPYQTASSDRHSQVSEYRNRQHPMTTETNHRDYSHKVQDHNLKSNTNTTGSQINDHDRNKTSASRHTHHQDHQQDQHPHGDTHHRDRQHQTRASTPSQPRVDVTTVRDHSAYNHQNKTHHQNTNGRPKHEQSNFAQPRSRHTNLHRKDIETSDNEHLGNHQSQKSAHSPPKSHASNVHDQRGPMDTSNKIHNNPDHHRSTAALGHQNDNNNQHPRNPERKSGSSSNESRYRSTSNSNSSPNPKSVSIQQVPHHSSEMPVAPSRRRRDRMQAKSEQHGSQIPLSRAHSTLSLISTATTIVSGCAESEI